MFGPLSSGGHENGYFSGLQGGVLGIELYAER